MRDAAIPLVVGLFLSTTSCPVDALPYTCRPEYQKLLGGLVHTACKPPSNNCIYVSTGLNMAEKAEVLKAHNDFRSRVAQGQLSGFPAATNMYRMKWDDDLAQVAQAFTNLCDDRHDKGVQRKTSKFPKVGQNIAWNYEPTPTEVIDSAGRVKDWFDEYQDFDPGNVDPFRVSPGRVVTHFTQDVIRSTSQYSDASCMMYLPRGLNLLYPQVELKTAEVSTQDYDILCENLLEVGYENRMSSI
ncbi:hypothetical protein HPB51_002964 [Rhipicephalus microplus]|uniref:SCP domain-containing protein n=1 Tax=Rhipicephalus microplus TaxID=6941 RepID=A0A9J6DSY6_RHIMP|nr:hypothetical protein HPB51_002964 [Rhipicephalus microplus]